MKARAITNKTSEAGNPGRAGPPLSMFAATTAAVFLLTGCMPYAYGEQREKRTAEHRQVLFYDVEKSRFDDFTIGDDGYVYLGCTMAVKNQTRSTVRFYLIADFAEDADLVPSRYGILSWVSPDEPFAMEYESLKELDFREFNACTIQPGAETEYYVVYKMKHGSVNTKQDREPPDNAVLIVKSMED